jgi:uncharacterized protein (DUF1800 family)
MRSLHPPAPRAPRAPRVATPALVAMCATAIGGSVSAQFTISQLPTFQCQVPNLMGTVRQADAQHVLNRVTFGPTTASIAAVVGTGAGFQAFMQSQLNPQGIAESQTLTDILAQIDLPVGLTMSTTGTLADIQDIQTARIAYAMLTERQLDELMTQFWEDHFNTEFFQQTGILASYVPGLTDAQLHHALCWSEWSQQQRLRDNALHTFESLLTEVTLSPAMMMYLNMDSVFGCSGNQNYAREFLELYTMGEFNKGTGAQNYDQTDIVEMAKVMSGWTLQVVTDPTTGDTVLQPAANGTAGAHCSGAKTLFTVQGAPHQFTVPAGTAASELAFMIDKVVAMDATKDFVCRKLAAYFLADAAAVPGVEDTLIAAMKAAWGNDGDIRAVLCTLFSSSAFQGTAYRWQRVRSPLEKTCWYARIWDATFTTSGQVSVGHLFKPWEDTIDIGQGLFLFPSPDGFPLHGLKRLGSSTTIETVVAYAEVYRGLKFAVDQNLSPALYWAFSPVPWFYQHLTATVPVAQQDTPAVVADAILERLYPGIGTTVDESAVATALGTLDHTNPVTYAVALARGIAVAMSFTYSTLK